jgi:hypothetical protein
MLTELEIRASWEAERDEIRAFCVEKKFNRKSIERFIDNYINSMVFARIPCPSKRGVLAAFRKRAR